MQPARTMGSSSWPAGALSESGLIAEAKKTVVDRM